MRVLPAITVLCTLALSSSALAQSYGNYGYQRKPRDADWSWRSQRAYEARSPAPVWENHDGYTRGQGGANWDAGPANGN